MSQDRVVRAMTGDGSFRAVAARSTGTASAILKAQNALGEDAEHLAELATLAVLYRELMSPGFRTQIVLRGAGGTGQALAESHPDGWARGLLRRTGESPLDLRGEGALLALQRPLRRGEIHRGTVAVPVDGRIASAAMVYFEQSEQTTSMVSLACVLADDHPAHVVACGGFVVQVLPEARDIEGPLALMTARLEEFIDLGPRLASTDADPDALIRELLYGFEIAPLGDALLAFGCACNPDRFAAALATLSSEDFEEIVRDGDPIESICDFCGRAARVSVAEARARRSAR